jgi:hypothetical protein
MLHTARCTKHPVTRKKGGHQAALLAFSFTVVAEASQQVQQAVLPAQRQVLELHP